MIELIGSFKASKTEVSETRQRHHPQDVRGQATDCGLPGLPDVKTNFMMALLKDWAIRVRDQAIEAIESRKRKRFLFFLKKLLKKRGEMSRKQQQI